MTLKKLWVKLNLMQSIEQEWIKGDVTLGAAAKWSADEIRLVSELGYALAEQGRNAEAIAIFEGLVALAPKTVYFESALGALWLREKNYEKAIAYLSNSIESDPKNIPTRVNRGEAYLQIGDIKNAVKDLNFVLEQNVKVEENSLLHKCIIRARALLFSAERLSSAGSD